MSSDDEVSSDDEDYPPPKKRRPVEHQPDDSVNKKGKIHLPMMGRPQILQGAEERDAKAKPL